MYDVEVEFRQEVQPVENDWFVVVVALEIDEGVMVGVEREVAANEEGAGASWPP